MRLNIFAKGNVDLRDSLLFSSVNEKVVWNGLNEILRAEYPTLKARIRHETSSRSDAMLQGTGVIPSSLLDYPLPLGAYPLASQFSGRVFDSPGEIVVTSIMSDVFIRLGRHRREGYLFYPAGFEEWPDENREWYCENFEILDRMDPDSTMKNLSEACRRWALAGVKHVLIFNMSGLILGDRVHCYLGVGETLSTRIRRFNLALVDLATQVGFSIVDVDSIVARAGGDRLRFGSVHLTPEGYELTAREVVRILHDRGAFD